jgi:pimeloyl-ACP methyl ester carboxylesterase
MSGPNPIVLIPGFMGSRLTRQPDGRLIWVDPLWIAVNLGDFVNGLTLRQPENPALTPDGVLHDVEIGDFVRVGIYREFHLFAIDPQGLGLAPADYREFAYDWRKSAADSAAKLDTILAALPDPSRPITLVAHSMGGLVAAALFAQAGPGAARVGKLIAIGCPFAGLLKTIDMIEQGSGILTLFFSHDPIRGLLSGWPGAYELMPSRPNPALFFDAAGQPSSPFLAAASMPGGRYDQALLAAAGKLVSGMSLNFPVPVRLIEGFGMTTAVSASVGAHGLSVTHDIHGDGTCPGRSLAAATGTATATDPASRVFSLPFAEHVELVRDPAVLRYLRDDLRGAPPAPQITARVRTHFALPGVDNLLVVETRDANGAALGTGAPTATLVDRTPIPLVPCAVAGQARWLGAFKHPAELTSINVTVPGVAPSLQPQAIHLLP